MPLINDPRDRDLECASILEDPRFARYLEVLVAVCEAEHPGLTDREIYRLMAGRLPRWVIWRSLRRLEHQGLLQRGLLRIRASAGSLGLEHELILTQFGRNLGRRTGRVGRSGVARR